MLEDKLKSIGRKLGAGVSVLSLIALIDCEKEGAESCYLPKTSEENLCYFHTYYSHKMADGSVKNTVEHGGYSCSSDQECKCLKPEGTSDDECNCECYTPSCCEKAGCSGDERCVSGYGGCECQTKGHW